MSLYRLLRKLPIPLWIAVMISEGFMLLYCTMVGFQASSLRAVFMFSMFLISKIFKRTYDLLTALALACILTLVLHPEYLFDCAFLLSFLSIFGIGVFCRKFFDNVWNPPRFLQPLIVSAVIFLTTLPVVLFFYYEAAFYSILLNLIVIPLMSVLMGAAICLVISINSINVLAFLPAFIVSCILRIYKICCAFLEQYGMGRSNLGCPGLVQIVVYYVIFLILFNFRIKNRIKKICIYVCGLFLAFFILFFRFQSGMDIYMLDVGQGDGSVIVNDNKNVYLIDGGSSSTKGVGEKSIIPFLKSIGVNEIEAVFISHPDQDHMNGIEELLQNEIREHIHVRQIYISNGLQNAEEFRNLFTLAKENKIPVKIIKKGWCLTDNKLKIQCLYPIEKGSIEELNNSSMVLTLKYMDFDMLFTGDIEESGEGEILKNIDHTSQSYEALKVSHHGSNSSTGKEFLEWCNPKVALVSVGNNNPYGHPDDQTIERLNQSKCTVFETKKTGCIQIHISKNKKWKIKGYL